MASYIGLVGPKHPHIFMIKNSLGCLELRRRNLDRAISYFEAAKAGFSATVGAQHASTMVVQMNIGRVQLERGHVELAAASFQTAKDGFVVSLGSGASSCCRCRVLPGYNSSTIRNPIPTRGQDFIHLWYGSI